jgi:hypothetical protein
MESAYNEKNPCPLRLRYRQVSLYLDERRVSDYQKTFRRWPLTTVIEGFGLQIYNMVNRRLKFLSPETYLDLWCTVVGISIKL